MFEYSLLGVLACSSMKRLNDHPMCNKFDHSTSGHIGKFGSARLSAREAEKASTKPFRRQLQHVAAGFISCIPHDSDIEKILTTLDCGSRKPDTLLLHFFGQLVSWTDGTWGDPSCCPLGRQGDLESAYGRIAASFAHMVWTGRACGQLGILVVLTKKKDRSDGIPTAAWQSEVQSIEMHCKILSLTSTNYVDSVSKTLKFNNFVCQFTVMLLSAVPEMKSDIISEYHIISHFCRSTMVYLHLSTKNTWIWVENGRNSGELLQGTRRAA